MANALLGAGETAPPKAARNGRRWLGACVLAGVGVALFFAYLGLSRTYPENSDEANILLMAHDMLHGNLLLRHWLTSDVPFITTELPQIALLVGVFGLHLNTAHIAAAMTYALVVLIGVLLARGPHNLVPPRAGLARMLLAGGIMFAPQTGIAVFVLILSVGHIGTAIPVMLAWLVVDRLGARPYVPVAVCLLLAWGEVADPLVLVLAVVPLALVNPGSVYHLTKTLDQLLFSFYAANDRLRITDLHQGIVWGTQTLQTVRDERLINRFDYDGDYGTVLNRFLMQAAIGHPLTVHGTGGQTRAFIHIRDTVRCIEIALENPPEAGSKPLVLNQMTETHRVLDLAKLVADATGADIAYLPNPRREAEENELIVRNDRFLALGLDPTTLSEGLLEEVTQVANRYRDRADVSKIIARSVWRKGMETSDDLLTELPSKE